jgi:ketosteroid isomerase-like protein
MSVGAEQAARQVFEAWNEGDLERVIDFLDPEFEFIPLRSQLDMSPYRGHEGMRQFAADTAEEWEYLRIVPDEIRDLGEHVLVLAHYRARGRASGAEVDLPVGYVATFRDGKFSYMRTYSDPDEAKLAAGVAG